MNLTRVWRLRRCLCALFLWPEDKLVTSISPLSFGSRYYQNIRPFSRTMVEIKDPECILSRMRSRVQEQGNVVRALKDRNASPAELQAAVAELKARKKLLEEKELELMPPVASFDRGKLEDLLKQKFFYDQAFSIYGGVQGLYDYGPMGCAMKANLLAAWRQHFVLEDQLLEVDCSMLTPAPVLQASGHVERFTDFMVKDVETGECFRADHLVKANLEAKLKHKKTSEQEKEELQRLLLQLDNFGGDELNSLIRKYGMRSPATNNELSEPQQFNLMFATMIGPTGQCQGYLRPETAQGIFVNFQRLLQFNQGRIPFGAAQIGSAFRNEISPRSGLIRVREFAMAEIEYFVDPTDKQHPKFDRVKDVEMTIYSACSQMDGLPAKRMTIGEAVAQGIVANQTLGYFMARIHMFLVLIGVDPNRLRFRQHLSNEMAHYACDCWDAECQTSYGWIECVGCADRSCYDLTQHAKATGTRLVAEKRLPEPRLTKVCECIPNKQAIGKAFRADAKSITNRLAALTLTDAISVKEDLTTKGSTQLVIGDKEYKIDPCMVHIKEYETNVQVEEIVPNVIEPSFGIGRLLYTVFEHSFRVREGDEQRTYLAVRPILAPYKCSLLPLSSHPDFAPFIQQLSSSLTRLGVTHRIDDSSGSIGRRYARTDQIAIPYGITIDFDTINKSPASATLRERDSMKQIRVPLAELPSLVNDLSNGVLVWSEAQSNYPIFEQQETVARDDESRVDNSTAINSPRENLQPMKKKTNKKHKVPDSSNTIATKGEPASTAGESAVEDWQSVSEDLDEFKEKPAPEPDHDADAWSSATETAEADAELTSTGTVPYRDRAKPNDSLLNKKNKTISARNGSSRAYSTAVSGAALSNTAASAKKPSLSWTDWGKAIRRRYQEEELREKLHDTNPLRTSVSSDVDEPQSPFSGYEADQEDNAASKSAAGHFSPVSKEHDTFYELSPTIQSINEEVGKEKTCATFHTNTPTDMDSDFPPLTAGTQPYHGLFVGEGWPGEKKPNENKPVYSAVKPEPKKSENGGKEPKKHVGTGSKPVIPVEHSTSTVSNKPVDNAEWPTVMAHVFEDNNEPEMWLQCMENPVPLPELSKHGGVRSEHTKPQDTQVSRGSTSPKKPPCEISNSTVEWGMDQFHGLFRGPGWPATETGPAKEKDITKGKSATKNQRRRHKSGTQTDSLDAGGSTQKATDAVQAVEKTPGSLHKPVLDDWKSVVAQIYEKTITPMVEFNSFIVSPFSGTRTTDQQVKSTVYEDNNPTAAPPSDPWNSCLDNTNDVCFTSDIWKPAEDQFSKVDYDLQREETNYSTTSEGGPIPETICNVVDLCGGDAEPNNLPGEFSIDNHSPMREDKAGEKQEVESSAPVMEPATELVHAEPSPIQSHEQPKVSESESAHGGAPEVADAAATGIQNKPKKNKSKRHKKKK
ncbi:Glycine--tRNA ligase [Clonorchis sinensis]|uniref:Glycine--tRNA ligase n=1 Tax=Clonorchis sinensis TaxID=79923 RepID=A0A8T1MBX8_CLOSI|nr:Glycine--tRNA ligase [Clonorchis sinensis]